VRRALESPRGIDMRLVNAQQARRVVDRLVGFRLSPFLWSKVQKGIGAGRVSSVALRLVVDREEEIRKFVPVESWTVDVELSKRGDENHFVARLHRPNSGGEDKLEVHNEAEAQEILRRLEGAAPHEQLPLDILATAFQRRVWEELRRIPVGETELQPSRRRHR